jgi:uncharacterized protein (TIGR02246 family)
MRQRKPIARVAVCALLLAAGSALNAQDHPRDEQAVRKVLLDFHEALVGRDFKAFGQCLADDAEFVNVTATLAKGREEIVKMHERAMDVVYKDIDFKALEAQMPEPVVTVRFLRADVVIAHTQPVQGDNPAGDRAAAAMHVQRSKDSRQVMISVLSKHGGKWLIDAVQNTVWGLAPTAPATAPK